MSDFDTVLERLVSDPAFAAALAADPVRTLAGYRLTADEVALLHTQVGGDTGGQHRVEVRATQSSLFGMLGSIGDLDGLGEQLGGPDSGGQGGGAPAGVVTGFGQVGSVQEGFGTTGPVEGFGAVGAPGHAVPGQALPPDGYRTRVDVDGDGRWDEHVVRGRTDGGVDILVDTDGDGRVDFVGRDADADGLIESASYDTDRDGVFDKRMYDDNGDGWLDRTVRTPPPAN